MKNEPAFPNLHPTSDCRYSDPGMALRDYFAAKAIEGWIHGNRAYPECDAENAYKLADAMLKAREAA